MAEVAAQNHVLQAGRDEVPQRTAEALYIEDQVPHAPAGGEVVRRAPTTGWALVTQQLLPWRQNTLLALPVKESGPAYPGIEIERVLPKEQARRLPVESLADKEVVYWPAHLTFIFAFVVIIFRTVALLTRFRISV